MVFQSASFVLFPQRTYDGQDTKNENIPLTY